MAVTEPVLNKSNRRLALEANMLSKYFHAPKLRFKNHFLLWKTVVIWLPVAVIYILCKSTDISEALKRKGGNGECLPLRANISLTSSHFVGSGLGLPVLNCKNSELTEGSKDI